MPDTPYPDSILAARRALRAGHLSVDELVRATFERIRAHNPTLNAYLEVFDPPAHSGNPADSLGGLPIAVKDLFDVARHRTTAGSPFLRDNIAREDATVVTKLHAAGAVLTGKTNLHEWALGVTNNNPHFGACRNPWDLDRIPGGSSGGSAAAVAAGLCLGALGSDTGGSIRIPAALCGVVGLKPTRGRVSLRGVVPLSWSHDHAGPIARTVHDTAVLLQAIAGYDPLDPASKDVPVPNYSGELQAGIKGLRIGVPASFFFDDLASGVGEAVRSAIDTLRAGGGATIVEIDLREAADRLEAVRVILLSDAAAYHRERLETQPEKFGADVLARLNAGRACSSIDYALARQARRQWQQRLRQVFTLVDVIVTPTTPAPAARIDAAEGVPQAGRLTRNTGVFNLAGAPAISVPCGFVLADGSRLPIGMQIVGRWWDEATVLRVAHTYEQATEWHTHRPPLTLSTLPTPR
jgi:aspartyl-tRNA(Asn)/glutamyl-tRNA(Gln) amidotransferase subunit A